MDIDLIEIFENAPLANQIILSFMFLMSIWVVYVAIERFLTYQKASSATYRYVLALKTFLEKREIDAAITSAKKHQQSPVCKVVESGLVAYKQGLDALANVGPDDVGEFDVVDSVNRSLERVKEREVANLRKGLGALATIASIAPFVGLLGTVFGIIGAFSLLKGGGGFEIIGPAIAESLIATAIGLFVAIPAAIIFNYFTGRVEGMVVDMSDVSSEFIDYVLREGRS